MNLPIETKTLVHKKFALSVVLLYVLIGILWILFSDEIFNYLLSNTNQFSNYVQYKRVVNIAITACLLYFLIRKTLQQTKTSKRSIPVLKIGNLCLRAQAMVSGIGT